MQSVVSCTAVFFSFDDVSNGSVGDRVGGESLLRKATSDDEDEYEGGDAPNNPFRLVDLASDQLLDRNDGEDDEVLGKASAGDIGFALLDHTKHFELELTILS